MRDHAGRHEAAFQPAPAPRPAPRGPGLLELQRSAGNRAVAALVQRDDAATTEDGPAGPGPVPPGADVLVPRLLPGLLHEVPDLASILRLPPLVRPTEPPWAPSGPQPAQGEDTSPRPGSAGDALAALAAVPAINHALDSAKARLLRDWRDLGSGGRALVIAQGALVAAPLLAQPDVRAMLDGLEIPVGGGAGSPWLQNLSVVLHTRGGAVGVGLQLDIAGLLRDRGAARPAPVRAVQPVVQRDEGDAPVRRPPLVLVELDALAHLGRPRQVPVPSGMSGRSAWAIEVTIEQAIRLAALGNTTLPARDGGPPVRSVTVVYTNDGRGPFPNIGGGADQEMTASVQVRLDFANEGEGWTSGGYNLEIWTPTKGGPARPIPGYEPGMYPGLPGPDAGGYRGLVYADFAYRLSGTGRGELTLLTRMGANSTALGEEIQSNWVHRPLDIALFDWKQEPTEPYAALGLRARTIHDLVRDDSATDSDLRLRLTLSTHALAGTHDTEAGGSATLSLRSGFVRIGRSPQVAAELRFGVDGRGIARYNDQGGERVGLEAAVSNEVRVHLRDVDLPWLPAFDAIVFAGARSQQSTLPEGRTVPGEDRPGATGAWLGPGSKTQGHLGIEIPIR
jgi:hypothetical protein